MQGLTTSTAQEFLKKYGKNELKVEHTHHWWNILWAQFTDVLVLILIAASIISFFVGETADGGVILFIVLLNASIGFFQEFRTERTLEALQNMIHPEIRVFRDGKEQRIATELLVPGDIVLLKEGDKVPADGILMEAHSLRIDESALTGESIAVEKAVKNQVFMGTSVVHGSGIFEIKETGMQTKFGEIAHLTISIDKRPSPLQKELSHIGIFVTKITGWICLGLFFIGIWRNFSLLDSLIFAVSVAIAAVPEGLPTTITIALALGATVIARKKAIIKKLSSVETLGSVTTICSDKTGTLTQNQMTVREIYLANRSIFNVTGAGYGPHGDIEFVGGGKNGKPTEHLLSQLLEVCEKCNEATLEKKHEKYTVLGDPTEGALLTLALKSHLPHIKSKVTDLFPFDSERKMMSVVTNHHVLVKGSPDQILDACTHWSDGEKTHVLTKQKRARIQQHYERMAGNALRVLAFAVRELPTLTESYTEKEVEKGLTFVGLVGMIDPPRASVRKAVEKCKRAGIRMIVITGDFGVTAEAIARELGIVEGEKVHVFSGDQVKRMSDERLLNILKDKAHPVIFAKSLPDQKMRIVKLLQSQKEIVAMTGDGVNDAPALKKADIGIAMGISGTDVSKETATMILTDDSFASIVTAIEEGRRIYRNLTKFIWFIFSCNIGELLVIFLAILFQFPLPLTAILILCVDLGTDILPAIALGVDTPEKDLMVQKPRDVHQRVMNKKFVQYFLLIGVVIGLSVTGTFLWTLCQDGWCWGESMDGNLVHAQSVAFTTLVIIQLVNAMSSRSERVSVFQQNPLKNIFLVLALFISVLMVLLLLYVPFLNTTLGTVPLSPHDWGIVMFASVIPLFVIEIRKLILRKKEREAFESQKVKELKS